MPQFCVNILFNNFSSNFRLCHRREMKMPFSIQKLYDPISCRWFRTRKIVRCSHLCHFLMRWNDFCRIFDIVGGEKQLIWQSSGKFIASKIPPFINDLFVCLWKSLTSQLTDASGCVLRGHMLQGNELRDNSSRKRCWNLLTKLLIKKQLGTFLLFNQFFYEAQLTMIANVELFVPEKVLE